MEMDEGHVLGALLPLQDVLAYCKHLKNARAMLAH